MSMLPLTFILPLLGFIILSTMRDKLSEKAATIVGVGSMGLSALFALIAGSSFLDESWQFCPKLWLNA